MYAPSFLKGKNNFHLSLAAVFICMVKNTRRVAAKTDRPSRHLVGVAPGWAEIFLVNV